MLRKLYYAIAGTDDRYSFEHRVFNLVTFVLTVFSIQATIFNTLLELHPVTIWLGVGGALLTLLIFYISRIRKQFNKKLLVSFIFISIAILDPLFFFNGASLGPTIYLMIMILPSQKRLPQGTFRNRT